MNTNRNNTTVIFNNIGKSMTPRLSNMEKTRRSHEAQYRVNLRARRLSRAQRDNQNNHNTNQCCVVLIVAVILLVAFCLQVKARDARISALMAEQQAYEQSTVLLSNGERVDREDYEQANEEARQAELEKLGLEG